MAKYLYNNILIVMGMERVGQRFAITDRPPWLCQHFVKEELEEMARPSECLFLSRCLHSGHIFLVASFLL